jgi:hypothetical protein
MNKAMKVKKTIENGVVSGYNAIETGVVSGYKAIENGVVSGYKKVEKKFVDAFLSGDDANAVNSDKDAE